MITVRSGVIRTICGGIVVCHTRGYNTSSDEENCSNVSNSLSTNKRKNPEGDNEPLIVKVVLDWY